MVLLFSLFNLFFLSINLVASKMPGDCLECNRKVAKTAKALRCAHCKEWCHTACGGLQDDDYVFMTNRGRSGFRWYCSGCVVDADDNDSKGKAVDEIMKKFQKMESLVSKSMQMFGARLDDLEGKSGIASPQVQSEIRPVKFAEIVKKALKEDRESTAAVGGQNKSKAIENQNLLIVKPKDGTEIADADAASSINKVEEALGEIQVTSCRRIKSGGLLMKFPSKEVMNKASHAIDGHLGPDHVMKVTEPKKMLPKMTVPDVSSSIMDEDIIPSILRKNPNIQQLVNRGYTLSLIFARLRDSSKTAVLKMAPEIRSEIVKSDGHIYVGLKRCKAYDRFWVAKCYHCQGFGHKSADCPKKDDRPVCAFCAGDHESRSCSRKNSPQCVNCLRLENRTSPTDHFASSLSCPVMMSQQRKIIENTNFACSRNMPEPQITP